MHFARLLAALLLFASLVGCSSSVDDTPVNVTPPASTAQIKAVLNDVVASGQLGSGGMILEQEIGNLRTTDAAKADILKKDYEELKAMTDPARATAKAKEMLSKL